MNRARAFSVAAAVMTAVAVSHPLQAQGEFAGTWTIAEWKVAPWVPAAERGAVKPNSNILNHTVTISPQGMTGPKLLTCARAKYEILTSPFEGLFEGGLKAPATDARALGFTAPVKTLRPNCDFDFHLRDAGSVLFALDNVLYTMKRKTPAPK